MCLVQCQRTHHSYTKAARCETRVGLYSEYDAWYHSKGSVWCRDPFSNDSPDDDNVHGSADYRAFTAFATSGGFGSFTGPGTKSFSDLLRSGGEASKDPSKTLASVFTVTLATPSTTPLSTPTKAPETPKVPGSVTDSTVKVPVEGKPVPSKGKTSELPQVKEPSYETISLTTSSSFVEVSAEEGEMGEETVLAEGESEDETHSFLSDVPSESEESA